MNQSLASDWSTQKILASDWSTQNVLASDWSTQKILASDWSTQKILATKRQLCIIKEPQYWPLIGQHKSHDSNTGR